MSDNKCSRCGSSRVLLMGEERCLGEDEFGNSCYGSILGFHCRDCFEDFEQVLQECPHLVLSSDNGSYEK